MNKLSVSIINNNHILLVKFNVSSIKLMVYKR
jgi:hypothetical protein